MSPYHPASATLDRASSAGARLDPLSDVLDTVRLRGAVFFVWEPGWPYGIGVADGRRLSRRVLPGSECVVSYHIVTQGPCWAAVHGAPPVRLETGDTLLLPRGDAYKIASTPQYPDAADERHSLAFFDAMAAGELPSVVTDGGPGPQRSRLVCGFLGCTMTPFNPLLSTLPRLLRVPGPGGGGDPLTPLISIALTETRQSRGGERSMLARLSEAMFVELLRRHLRAGPGEGDGWLAGLRDPLVAHALGSLHRDVARHWTLPELARSVGASRSALSERFTRIIGMPPMQYLAQWRMQVAAHRLRDSHAKVLAVAIDVGYRSEAAFSRAFKRLVGQTPREWRSGASCRLAESPAVQDAQADPGADRRR